MKRPWRRELQAYGSQPLHIKRLGGVMRKALAVLVTGALAALCTGSSAQELPKSGRISFHTGWKDTSVAVQVADKHWQGQGIVTGATFNDRGTGPLHLGPANCSYTFFAIEGNAKNMGFCTFGDADGDRIFAQFTGAGTPDGEASGTNEITGGTGKYARIQGRGPWKCKGVGANGEYQCVQSFDYRLP